MKTNFLATIIAIATVLPSVSFASDKSLGIKAGYNSHTEAPTAGIWFQYSFSDHLRLSPDAIYYFRKNGTDALALNCNIQLPFALDKANRFSVYPLGGINYTSWNFHNGDILGIDDVSSRHSRFGINAGAGAEYRVNPTLKLAVEAKATLVKSYNSANISLSVGYIF